MSASYGPQHPPMTAAEARAARTAHDRVRDGRYLHTDAVVRAWRAASVEAVATVALALPDLADALDELADGWPS